MPPRTKKMIRKKRKYNNRKIVYIKPRIPLNGLQKSEIVKMRYVQTLQIANGTGHVAYHFRANSLYDPDYDGAGHQPMGYDQMAAKYNHYQVLGSRIKIRPVLSGTSTAQADEPSWVTVSLVDNNGITHTTIDSLLESKPYGKQQKIMVGNYGPWQPDAIINKVLSAYYDPKRFFGINKTALLAEEDLKPSVNQNPNEDAMYQIMVYPVQPNSTRDIIQLLVEIDYTAKFSEPKDIVQS
jgi:hypothetical protein